MIAFTLCCPSMNFPLHREEKVGTGGLGDRNAALPQAVACDTPQKEEMKREDMAPAWNHNQQATRSAAASGQI